MTLFAPVRIGAGFRRYERFDVSLQDRKGKLVTFDREVTRCGPVVGILPIDLAREQMVLVRQFRLGGHLALARGAMVEIPAGRIDADETDEAAAARECREEIGVEPRSLRKVLTFTPAPALCDELFTLFVASIDASATPAWAGCAAENEEIEVLRLDIGTALRLAEGNHIHSGPTIIALQWLALNRASLPRLLGAERQLTRRLR